MKIVTRIVLAVIVALVVAIGGTFALITRRIDEVVVFDGVDILICVVIGFVLVGALCTILRIVLLDRLLQIQRGMAEIGRQDLQYRLPSMGTDEIGTLASTFNDMAGRLEEGAHEKHDLEADLRESQKLEAVGQLAGGIAHEINTPSQYIGDNLNFLTDSHGDLFELIGKCMTLAENAKNHEYLVTLSTEIEIMRDQIDLDYLYKEIPAATEQSLAGLAQVSRIVMAMREISHPGTKEMILTDINKTIENALIVSRNEWKHVADLVTSFDENLPDVPCLSGEINQVFLNLIVNAAHAIADNKARLGLESAVGEIGVSTEQGDEMAIIRVSDNGAGIPDDIRDQIFNPFFTTKGIGKGTGQGLAIARDIVAKKHGGTISFETEVGMGTTFTVKLPIRETLASIT